MLWRVCSVSHSSEDLDGWRKLSLDGGCRVEGQGGGFLLNTKYSSARSLAQPPGNIWQQRKSSEREEMNTKQCHQSENKMLCIKGNLLTTTIQGYNLLHLLVIFRSLATCIYLMERSIIFVIWQEQGTKDPLNELLLVRWGRNKLPVLHRMFLPQKLVGLVRFTVIVPNLEKRNVEL